MKKFWTLLLGMLACGTPSGPAEIPANCAPVVDDTVLACRGTFILKAAKSLCPRNYLICSSLPPGRIDACKQNLGGFFASAVGAYHRSGDPENQISCVQPDPLDRYGLSGCGAMPARAPLYPYAGTTCGGYPAGIYCFLNTGWNCPNSLITEASNDNPSDGVLCCLDLNPA